MPDFYIWSQHVDENIDGHLYISFYFHTSFPMEDHDLG
jgi:hypothetical protein